MEMGRSKRHVLMVFAAIAALALLAAGCGGGSKKKSSPTTTSGPASSASVTPPANIKSAGKLVFCSDITYPPEESFGAGNKPIGSDIDFGTAVAQLMGVKAVFKNTTFDSIIAALKAKKCDAIISGMNDTAERRKQVDFVDYLKVGQSLMVKKGNPSHIATLADLAGKSVSVESGTTNRDFLATQSGNLVKQGKTAISIKTFPKDTDAASALKAGRVDAYFGDSPVVVYYVSKDPSFSVGGSPINPIPIGIAVRKGDPLGPAITKAIDMLYSNGSIKKIVAKWGMTKAVTLLK
jgi:polar amino acid transport system substrate-binding protein